MISALYSAYSRLPLASLAARPAFPLRLRRLFSPPIWTSLQAPLEQTQLGDTVYNLVYSRNQTPTLGQHSHRETSGQSRKHGLSRQRDTPPPKKKILNAPESDPLPGGYIFLGTPVELFCAFNYPQSSTSCQKTVFISLFLCHAAAASC